VMIKLVKDGIVEPLITYSWLLMNQRVILVKSKFKIIKKKGEHLPCASSAQIHLTLVNYCI
jgi:hypothetical protein